MQKLGARGQKLNSFVPMWCGFIVRNVQSRSGVDNKSEKQPWPQLVCCALICCCMCGCVFQKDRIVARSSEEKWYIDKISYDGKYPLNNIISFIFYIITNFSLLNSCCLLL